MRSETVAAFTGLGLLLELKHPVSISLTTKRGMKMSLHNAMPPVPAANRSNKGTGDHSDLTKDVAKVKGEVNVAEQGETANIKQNTTNAGFFKGRRVK
jgi:hypothetical protein